MGKVMGTIMETWIDISGSDGVKLAGHRKHMTDILLHINDFLDYLMYNDMQVFYMIWRRDIEVKGNKCIGHCCFMDQPSCD